MSAPRPIGKHGPVNAEETAAETARIKTARRILATRVSDAHDILQAIYNMLTERCNDEERCMNSEVGMTLQ